MSIEITLKEPDLANIVLAANRALEVAHREYMRLRGAFAYITSEAIGTEQERIMEALHAGEALPDGDAALQIAAFYEQTVGTVVGLVKEIQGARGTGVVVANLYFLLAQQTGFLMALDAQSRGEAYPDQLANYRQGRPKGARNKSTEAIHGHIRELLTKGIPRKKLYAEADPEILGGMAEATFKDHVRKVKNEIN
jgi:hypothetical protein